MIRRIDRPAAALLAALTADPRARVVAEGPAYRVEVAGERRTGAVPAALLRRLLAGGLLTASPNGGFAASPAAIAWIRRAAENELPFLAQHHAIESRQSPDAGAGAVRVNSAESPIALLARRTDKAGRPWLARHAVDAAERLRRDFEMGGLQPRVTSNWSASVNTGRRTDSAGLNDLTDAALAARIRFSRAMKEVGPELCGVLVDVCCFLKGLEAVERERGWPARSGKLALRLGLDALARHYGLSSAASGPDGRRELRHWGADDYRPTLT